MVIERTEVFFKCLRFPDALKNGTLRSYDPWSIMDMRYRNILTLHSHSFLDIQHEVLNKFLDLEIFKFEFRFNRADTLPYYSPSHLFDKLGNRLAIYRFRKILYDYFLYPIIYFKHSISDGYDIEEKKAINVFDKYNDILKILDEYKIKMHKKINDVLTKSLKNTEIVLEECSTSEQLLNSIYDMTTHELQYISSTIYSNLSFIIDTINLMSFEKYIYFYQLCNFTIDAINFQSFAKFIYHDTKTVPAYREFDQNVFYYDIEYVYDDHHTIIIHYEFKRLLLHNIKTNRWSLKVKKYG
jgi:hypothetical protein